MRNSNKNNKGQMAPTMTLGVATLVIIFLLAIFLIMVSFVKPGMSGQVEAQSIKLSNNRISETILISYLNTPLSIEIEGKMQNIVVSDLIRLAFNDKSYQKTLREKTREILDPIYDEYVLHAPPLEIVSGSGRPIFSTIIIPGKEPIKVILGIID